MAARPAPSLWLRQNQSVIRREWLYAGTGIPLPEQEIFSPHKQQKALMLPEKPGSSRLPALWCRWRDLNPHASSATDFESASSANSNTPARQGLLYTTRAAKSSAEKAAAGNSRGGPDFHRSISPRWRYISFPPPEAPAASSAPRWSERRFQSAP